jgi:hypothetical protein
MLPAEDISGLSWQGSAGASGYDIERAESTSGPWTVIGLNVSDAATPHKKLFNDYTAEIGESYYYRLRAKNNSGSSDPSNVIGPLEVKKLTLVDEFENYGMLFHKEGELSPKSQQARKYKEDWHRVEGGENSELIYALPGRICDWRIYYFSGKDKAALEIQVSEDGRTYNIAETETESYFSGEQDYDYLVPIKLFTNKQKGVNKFLKIRFLNPTQIGRVEISHER